eukprot:Lankesteria_metandrocarpae@DN3709_c0_g1_i1.p1
MICAAGGVRSASASRSWELVLQKLVDADKLQLADGCNACLLDFGDISRDTIRALPVNIPRTCGQLIKANSSCAVVALVDSCSHVFHSECIRKWAAKENSCPQCKKTFKRIGCYLIDGRRIDSHPIASRRLSKTLELDDEDNSSDVGDEADDTAGTGSTGSGSTGRGRRRISASNRRRPSSLPTSRSGEEARASHTDTTLCSLCDCPGASALVTCSGPCRMIAHYFCVNLDELPPDTSTWRCPSCTSTCTGATVAVSTAGRQRGRRRRLTGTSRSTPAGRTPTTRGRVRSRTSSGCPSALLDLLWDFPVPPTVGPQDSTSTDTTTNTSTTSTTTAAGGGTIISAGGGMGGMSSCTGGIICSTSTVRGANVISTMFNMDATACTAVGTSSAESRLSGVRSGVDRGEVARCGGGNSSINGSIVSFNRGSGIATNGNGRSSQRARSVGNVNNRGSNNTSRRPVPASTIQVDSEDGDLIADDCIFTRAPPVCRGLPPDCLDNDEFERQLYGRAIAADTRDSRMEDSGGAMRGVGGYKSLLEELLSSSATAPVVPAPSVRVKRRFRRNPDSSDSRTQRCSVHGSDDCSTPTMKRGCTAVADDAHCSDHCTVVDQFTDVGSSNSSSSRNLIDRQRCSNAGTMHTTGGATVNGGSVDEVTVDDVDDGCRSHGDVLSTSRETDANPNVEEELTDIFAAENFTEEWFSRIKVKFAENADTDINTAAQQHNLCEEEQGRQQARCSSNFIQSDDSNVAEIDDTIGNGTDPFWLELRDLADANYAVPVGRIQQTAGADNSCSVDSHVDTGISNGTDNDSSMHLNSIGMADGGAAAYYTDGQEFYLSDSINRYGSDEQSAKVEDGSHAPLVAVVPTASSDGTAATATVSRNALSTSVGREGCPVGLHRAPSRRTAVDGSRHTPCTGLVNAIRGNLERMNFESELKKADYGLWKTSFKATCKRIVENETEKHRDWLKSRINQHKFWETKSTYLQKAVKKYIIMQRQQQ